MQMLVLTSLQCNRQTSWKEIITYKHGNLIFPNRIYRKKSSPLIWIIYDVVVRKKVIQKELDREEKKIKDLNKDLLKLGEKNEDLHKDIENYKKKITEAQKNIEKNLNDQDTKMVEIGAQKKVVDKVIDRLNSVGKN